MKKLLILLVLLAGLSLAGCGLTDTNAERVRRYKQINDLQSRMLVDDWDHLWLYEKNSHLTEFHPRIGL